MQALKENRFESKAPTIESLESIDRSKSPKPKSIVIGSLWMLGLTLALFFLPLINGFIGGVVGGYKVGSVKRALVAALLPAAFVTISLWVLFSLFALPVVGLLAGVTTGILVLISNLGMFVGAVVGGAISDKQIIENQ